MRPRFVGYVKHRVWRRGLGIAVLLIACLICLGPIRADEQPAAAADPPAADSPMSDMHSAGWLERIVMQLENEAVSDVSMAPDTGAALVREWRSLSRDGSSLGALISVLWVAVAAAIAVGAERLASRGLSHRLRQRMRT